MGLFERFKRIKPVLRKYSVAASVLLCLPAASNALPAGDALFTDILSSSVKGGLVDYRALARDGRLPEYMDFLSEAEPGGMDAPEELAFWINAYNAYALKLIIDNYPVGSIRDLGTGFSIFGTSVFEREFFVIAGRKMSLDNIEHDIIRERFREPRIHFALVCAAKSCPPLRGEAYTAENLDEQLDEQAEIFINHAEWNSFDPARKRARLSRIFRWYGGDFGDSRRELLVYIAPYVNDPEIRESLMDEPGRWSVRYANYDWSLNDAGKNNLEGR